MLVHVWRPECPAPTGLASIARRAPSWPHLRRLRGDGLPAAAHLTTAMGVITVVTTLALGLAFMATMAGAFLAVPKAIIRVFTGDARVIATGVALLLIAAAFQLFDGAQVVLTGVLRGTGDTRTPMVANVVGYWVIGLPVGCVPCFGRGLGVSGLWVGLCIGLVFVGLTLLGVWTRRTVGRVVAVRRATG